MKKNKNIAGLGVITALGASLCCIAPMLAIVAGTSGVASSFSFLEPIRPYLIGFTVLVLGYAWYEKLKPTKEIDCDCEPEENQRFLNSKKFLVLISLASAVLLLFPYYSGALINSNNVDNGFDKSSLVTINLPVEGMTCTGCEEHIIHEVSKLNGVEKVSASYEKENTVVSFDSTVVAVEEIVNAVNKTGYVVKYKEDI